MRTNQKKGELKNIKIGFSIKTRMKIWNQRNSEFRKAAIVYGELKNSMYDVRIAWLTNYWLLYITNLFQYSKKKKKKIMWKNENSEKKKIVHSNWATRINNFCLLYFSLAWIAIVCSHNIVLVVSTLCIFFSRKRPLKTRQKCMTLYLNKCMPIENPSIDQLLEFVLIATKSCERMHHILLDAREHKVAIPM